MCKELLRLNRQQSKSSTLSSEIVAQEGTERLLKLETANEIKKTVSQEWTQQADTMHA